MKVLLIQPPLNPNIIGAGIAYLTEPLALEVIAASIPNHETEILDMRLELNLEQELISFHPQVVGVTGYTTDVYNNINILKKVKEFDSTILTIVGGHHATIIPKDFDKEVVDVIVIGEGEITFKELIDAYEKGQNFEKIKGLAFRKNDKLIFTQPREMPSNLDALPLPARHLTEKYRQKYFRSNWRPVTSLMTSKGCPFRCDFCALWKITNGKYLIRSPESVVSELSTIKEKYIDFADDNVFHDLKRVERIYELIKERGIKKKYKVYARSDTIVKRPDIVEKWKEIGMDLILIGFESFKDEELKALNKHNSIKNNEKAIQILHQNGVEIVAYFIINPDYTKEDFDALAEYINRMELTQPIFTVLTPLPGTELYKRRYHEMTNHNYELFDFVHSLLPTRLPKKEFYECLIGLYQKCYNKKEGRIDEESIGSTKMMRQVFSLLSEAHKL